VLSYTQDNFVFTSYLYPWKLCKVTMWGKIKQVMMGRACRSTGADEEWIRNLRGVNLLEDPRTGRITLRWVLKKIWGLEMDVTGVGSSPYLCRIYRFLLTNSMESPWEANSHTASQLFHCLLWNQKDHYRVCKNPPVSQMKPVQNFSPWFPKIHSKTGYVIRDLCVWMSYGLVWRWVS